jgi:hypothetical protein
VEEEGIIKGGWIMGTKHNWPERINRGPLQHSGLNTVHTNILCIS